jgi:hypothetical protein
VLRELRSVETLDLKVAVEAGGCNDGEYRVSGWVKAFTKDWCGFAAPALATDRGAMKEVIIALLWFVARWASMIVSSFIPVKPFSSR